MDARWLVPGLVAAAVGVASANGGPVEWTRASGRGGLAPVGVDIALVREDLRITVAADGRHYDVVARYQLSNPGPARRLTFGVPVAWAARDRADEDTPPSPATRSADARAMARTVRVTSGGRSRGCTLTDEDAPLGGTQGDLYQLRRAAWCTTALRVAGGGSTVTLRYRGELEFSDSELSSSPLTARNYRTLYYPLYPAGGWTGPTRLDVVLDPGPFAGLVDLGAGGLDPPRPAGATVRGDNLVWSFAQVDLTAVPELIVHFLPEPFFLPRDLARWNHASAGAVRVRAASSALAGGRHAPARIVDGDLTTAWCEGVAGDGVGAWIEVEYRGARDELLGCRPSPPGLVSGHVKNPTVWRASGRVTRVRFGPCGSTNGYEQDVPLAARFDRAGSYERAYADGADVIVDELRRSLEERGSMCVRMTILAVAPGTTGHTCVSELAPLVNCG